MTHFPAQNCDLNAVTFFSCAIFLHSIKSFNNIDDFNKKIHSDTVKILKFRSLFSFCISSKILVSRAGIHKVLVGIANKEDHDQTVSSEAA